MNRGPLPFERKKLEGAPVLNEAMRMCIAAWKELGGERQLGLGGLGDIPFRAVLEWAEFQGLDDELTHLLWNVIRRLDRDRREADASARSKPNNPKNPKPKARR